MKKLAIFIFLVGIVAISWADKSRRIFELGFDVNIAASNNYIGLTDLMTETLVIDLDQISKDLSSSGFRVAAEGGADFFMNLNLKKLQLGLFTNIQGTGFSSLPGSLFELLAEGNEIDKAYKGDLQMWGDLNLEMGANVASKIETPIGPIQIKIEPVYYMPLLHLHKPTASYMFETKNDGTVVATGIAEIPIYSVISLENIDGSVDIGGAVGTLFSSGGLDLSVTGDYQLFPFLSVGATLTQVPIVPARMKNRSLLKAKFSVETLSVLESIDSGDPFTTTENSEFIYDSEDIMFIRPLKFGTHAAYQPFGKLLTVTPNLGLGYYDSLFMEFGLEGKLNLANIFIFSLSTAYEDLVWKEQIGFVLNFRVVELHLLVGSYSPSFLKSFTLAGAGATLGMRFGF